APCPPAPRLIRRPRDYVKAFDGVIAQHAEEPRLTEGAQMHEGEVSTRLGLTGWPRGGRAASTPPHVDLTRHHRRGTPAGRPGGPPPARLPRVPRRFGRGAAPGQGPRGAGDRRGHAAPP